jgi:hypothetical protein
MFAQIKAATVAPARTDALPVSVLRKERSAVFLRHKVSPADTDSGGTASAGSANEIPRNLKENLIPNGPWRSAALLVGCDDQVDVGRAPGAGQRRAAAMRAPGAHRPATPWLERWLVGIASAAVGGPRISVLARATLAAARPAAPWTALAAVSVGSCDPVDLGRGVP